MKHNFLAFMDKMEQKSSISSIKKSFITIFPVILVGATSILLMNFPIPSIDNFIQTVAGGKVHDFLKGVYDCTFGFLSIYLVLAISYYYSCTFKVRSTTLQIMAMITSLVCFIVLNGTVSSITFFGTIGVFTSLIVPILATKLFLWLCLHSFKRLKFYASGADITFKTSMTAVFPMAICIALFFLVTIILSQGFHVDNVNLLISKGLAALFSKFHYGLLSGILFVFIENFLWFFGIHGANALETVAQALFVPADFDPNLIVSKTFFDTYSLIGGNGVTLCLVIAVLIASKNKSNRKLVKAAIPTVIFNINEIIIFGLPIVFNPVMIIPFILVPIVSIIIAYIATAIGFIPIISRTVTWTTPVFFSGYMASNNSIRGVIVQLIVIIVGVLIYIPFIKLYEELDKQSHKTTLDEMKKVLIQSEREGKKCNLVEYPSKIGTLAKNIAYQLRSDILDKKINVFYQPQHDKYNKIIGAEALLRWEYDNEYLFPPLVIQIGKDDEIIDELTRYVLETCCEDCKVFKKLSIKKFTLSMNIIPEQLDSNSFVDFIIETVQKHQLCDSIALEVTEHGSILHYQNIAKNIERLKQNQISVSIDDFSMGHTSLKYLQEYAFECIKLDGSLVRQLLNNPRSQEITASIIQLGKSLNFKVTAEYVENQEIEAMLKDMGCDYFQGYLYSPAIPRDEFIDYMYLR